LVEPLREWQPAAVARARAEDLRNRRRERGSFMVVSRRDRDIARPTRPWHKDENHVAVIVIRTSLHNYRADEPCSFPNA
jgi:hypothetical protein